MIDSAESERPSPVSARDVAAGSREAILVHDPDDGTILSANGTAERCYGRGTDELRGSRIDDCLATDQVDETDVRALAEADHTVDWRVTGPDGTTVLDVSVRAASSSPYLLSFGRDVTEHRQRADRLREDQETLRRLQEIAAQRDVGFDAKVNQLLELGRDWLGLSVGYVTRIEHEVQTVDAAVGPHEEIQPGGTAPLSETYCQHTLDAAEEDDPVYGIRNADESGITSSEEYARFGLSCYLGGAITVDGTTYGTICFADTEPRAAPFTSMERTFVDLLTGWLGLTIERQRQAAQLRERHELTSTILDSSPTGICVFGADGAVEMANERATDLLGDGTELEGETGLPATLYDESGRRVSGSELPQARVAEGESLNNVRYRLDGHGRPRYLSISGRPLSIAGGDGVVLTVEDVTEQRRQTAAMGALTDTLATATGDFESQLRELLDVGRTHLGVANGHLSEIEDDTHHIVASEGLSDLLSVGLESDLDVTYCQSIVERDGLCSVTEASVELPDSPAVDRWGLETYIGTTVSVDGELYGTICFADERARGASFSEWERTFVETLGRWIETQVRRRRDAVERDRDRALLEAVFDSQRTQVGITDTDGRLVDANDAALEFVEADATDVTDTPVWETPWFTTEESRRQCRVGVERALDGEMVNFEISAEDADGELAVSSVNIRPVFEDGSVINAVVEGHDITELRARERELERRQRHIDTILDNVPLVLFAVDGDGEFLDSRGRGLASFGLDEGELVGQTIYDEYAGAPDVIGDYERARDGEAVESVRTIGETVFRSWYRGVEVDGETHVIGIAVDITEQQRQKERVAAVNEATEELMYARTPVEVGESLVDIVGDLIPYPLAGVWVPGDHGDALEPIAATDRTLDVLDGETAGDALPAIESGSMEMAVFEGGETRIVESYAETDGEIGQAAPIETVVMVPLGQHGLLHVGSPTVQQPSDVELDLIGILARNAEAALVSTNREVELAAYKDELERSNRALQEFAYIASHDLQEPLRMVASYVDLLESEYADQLDDEAGEYMAFAVDGARRMQNMINALLEYSRVETQGNDFERVELETVVETTLDALQLRIDETGATVTVGELPAVEGDPDQLGQLCQNLLENAIQYADEDGADPRVSIDATRGNDGVTLSVTDNGPGIPEERREDVFEIFSRGGAHDSDGTGIGLAVCRRIVRRHDGAIRIAATDSPGTQFRVTLPAPPAVTDDV